MALLLKRMVSQCPGCGTALLCSRSSSNGVSFPPSRVVVVKKTTRLQYERKRNQLSEEELRNRLSKFGSDYENLKRLHSHQTKSLEVITNFLDLHGVQVRIRDRESYSEADVEWAESIFSAGGDGNFLWASSKVMTSEKLLVGLNTDPQSSEGYLCLNSSRYGSLERSLEALFRGEVPRYPRARIRVEVDGELLPVRALNEVFVGERNPSHAAYYELSSDNQSSEKQKSSGLLIYTGTGSTSWAYNANKMTSQEVERVLTIARGKKGWDSDAGSKELVAKVLAEYNSMNVFPGEEMSMAYVVREPIIKGIFAAEQTQGKASSIGVKSLSWNTELVVDGQFHFNLRRGGVVRCWLHPQDVLTTLHGLQ